MMIRHDLKMGWRNLLKYKLQAIISISGLAVGLLCFTICNDTLVNKLMWNQRMPYADEIYSLAYDDPEQGFYPWIESQVATAVREEFPEVEKSVHYIMLGGVTDKICVVKQEDGTETSQKEHFIYTDSTFMEFYGFRLLQGNWEKLKRQPDGVILTLSGATRIFGTSDAVGRTFTDVDDFSGRVRQYTVVALMLDFPAQTDFEISAGIVMNPDIGLGGDCELYIRLRKGASAEDFTQKLAHYAERHPELKDREGRRLLLCPLLSLRDHPSQRTQWIFPLLLSGFGFLVLLAAVFNYVLFMSGRISNRQKEYGVRLISGATPQVLFKMLCMEITLSVCLSLLLGLLLLEVVQFLLAGVDWYWLALDDWRNWVAFRQYFLLNTVVVWGVMSGVCWFILKRVRTISLLRNLQGGEAGSKTWRHNILLGFQLCICILFLGGAYFTYTQQSFLQEKMAGRLSSAECKRIYAFNLNGDKLEKIRTNFVNGVEANPYITEWCRSGMSLLSPWSIAPEYWWMSEIEEQVRERISYSYVDAGFSDFIHARMEEGRFFREDEPTGAVVNREFARRWGINPLGKEIGVKGFYGPKTYHIVGIIEDILPLAEEPKVMPCIYLPYPEGHVNLTYYVKLAAGADPKVLEPLKEMMQAEVSSFTPLWIESLADDISDRMSFIRETGALSMLLALICMVISLLGIYSSMMLAVEKRSREMAIRKINGASLTDIARIYCRHYLWVLGGAAIVAFPVLYLGIQTWLQSYSCHITVTLWPFISIFMILVVIILLTIGSQLLKIMRINPVERLKSE